ncbi:hypothetical protein [Pseudomonas zhanjiangensis]|uniref:DUF4398 domain-containing protein n=1 Tax=Pseudomonas zhanjiangensis TaxID=3239015 RepID=A0ABV3YR72_9PSED
MSRILSLSFATVIAASCASYVSASQEQDDPACLTNELDKELISSSVAIVAGECHLDAASKDKLFAMQHAQYAYSWFAYAQQLSRDVDSSYLKQAAKKIDELQVKQHEE